MANVVFIMMITPLDNWVKGKTGDDIATYQLEKLNETLRTVQKGTHYQRTLPQRVESLSELKSLPIIDAETLTRSGGTGLICVPQDEITRIVTLTTSGSTGAPKRIYFTKEDQELTVDYFANGLLTVVPPGGTMAVLLPYERPGSVGDLIACALQRIPVTPVRHGPVSDLASCANTLRDSGAGALVGTAVHVLAVARYCEAAGIMMNISGVLLSTDNVPHIVRQELKRIWGCDIYEHYGMTEMGLGGAIDCDAHDGYHIRENDLLFEIIDENGNTLPDGVFGEIVFTTLTRRGMPFVRYRTGDISRIIPGRCVCGSSLKRIAPIAGRVGCDVTMHSGAVVRMRDFDEVLFSLPCISDYWLSVSPCGDMLFIDIDVQESFSGQPLDGVETLLLGSGLADGFEIKIRTMRRPDILTPRTGKRQVIVSQIL